MTTLDDHLEAVLEEGAPGAVVLAADRSSTWEKAAGIADLSTGAPMTPDHRFRIASVTKLFTAAVVLQLVDEGALALDAEVGSIEGGVTVRHLLNHTSGLQNFAEIDALFEPYRKDRAHRSDLTPRDVLALIAKTPRRFAPGRGGSTPGATTSFSACSSRRRQMRLWPKSCAGGSLTPWGSRTPICRTRSRRRPASPADTSPQRIQCSPIPVRTRST